MAFQDLLDAITADTDKQIRDQQSQLRVRLSALREESERKMAGRKQDIHRQRDARKTQLWRKADTMAQVEERNILLHAKRDMIDATYDKVVSVLGSLDAAKQKHLLTALLKAIKPGGIVHPARSQKALLESIATELGHTLGDPIDAAGGFLYVSPTEERDCTYEFLVRTRLRPATDIRVASTLFSASA